MIRGRQLECIEVDADVEETKINEEKRKAKALNEACQTQSYEYIEYMSDIYYNELRLMLQEELSAAESQTLKALLARSKQVIDKIKFKAAKH